MRGRGSSWKRRAAIAGAVAAGTLLGPAQPAGAACHAFTVEVEPGTVAEGTAVTVTVRRDAAVGPSQIDVETVDGTAAGGSDYEAVPRRTVSFSSETEQSFTVATIDDADDESDETFALHLSNPAGCTVNPNFVVGPDAQVTVTDNDDAAQEPTTSAPSGQPTTTARPATTSTASGETTSSSATDSTTAPTSTSSSSSTSSTTSTSTDVGDLAADDRDDGGADGPSGVVVALAALVVIAVAGGGVWAWRRRAGTG